jgi:hypothetical protein
MLQQGEREKTLEEEKKKTIWAAIASLFAAL